LSLRQVNERNQWEEARSMLIEAAKRGSELRREGHLVVEFRGLGENVFLVDLAPAEVDSADGYEMKAEIICFYV